MELEDKMRTGLREVIEDYDLLLPETRELLLRAYISGYVRACKDSMNRLSMQLLNEMINKVKPKL